MRYFYALLYFYETLLFLILFIRSFINWKKIFFLSESTSEGATEGTYNGGSRAQLIYGVFTTPVNSIGGSAVCAFSMEDLLRVFLGPFKEQETINSNWLRVLPEKVPEPRPGACANDSRTLPDVTVNFVKSHPLMDEAVQSYFTTPVVTKVTYKWVIFFLFIYFF